MDQSAVDFFKLLVQVGAVPGEDFSCDANEQVYYLTEHCYTLLSHAYPEEDWQEIIGVLDIDMNTRIEQLQHQLGCPFTEDLVQRMKQRLGTLPAAEAAGYFQAILAGVEAATAIVLYPLLTEQLPLEDQVRLEWLLRQEPVTVPSCECVTDLVLAAGGTPEDCEIQAGEVLLTEAGWQRLCLVWDGDCVVSMVNTSS